MTKHTNRAAGIIVRIADEAESDSVRLRAARAIFSDLITVSKYSVLEDRMLEIEQQLEQRDADASSTAATWTPTSYGQGATPPEI